MNFNDFCEKEFNDKPKTKQTQLPVRLRELNKQSVVIMTADEVEDPPKPENRVWVIPLTRRTSNFNVYESEFAHKNAAYGKIYLPLSQLEKGVKYTIIIQT